MSLSSDCRNVESGSDLGEDEYATGPLTGPENLKTAQNDGQIDARNAAGIDTNLARLIDAWPMLPESIRQKILTLVDGCGSGLLGE